LKHICDKLSQVIEAIKKQYPEYENIKPPIEMFSGRMYLSYTADKPFRGKKKQVCVPVLLSKCPFCGEKYKEDESLCIRCGEKPAIIPGNYCKECDERIDNGPVSRFFQAGGTKEEFEALAKDGERYEQVSKGD
jgi:hypothetical protein